MARLHPTIDPSESRLYCSSGPFDDVDDDMEDPDDGKDTWSENYYEMIASTDETYRAIGFTPDLEWRPDYDF